MDSENQKIDEIKKILGEIFSPSRLFLYGSRVSKTAAENSDFDFVVVVNKTERTRWDNHEFAKNAILKGANVLTDVWVYTENEFNDWKDEFSSIPETALNTGIELTLE